MAQTGTTVSSSETFCGLNLKRPCFLGLFKSPDDIMISLSPVYIPNILFFSPIFSLRDISIQCTDCFFPSVPVGNHVNFQRNPITFEQNTTDYHGKTYEFWCSIAEINMKAMSPATAWHPVQIKSNKLWWWERFSTYNPATAIHL